MPITPFAAPPLAWTPDRSGVSRGEGLGRFGCAMVLRFGFMESVLDVGAGSGNLRRVLGKACGLYLGIDQSANDGIVVADAHELPVPDRSFDVVCSKQTLPHFRDPAKALAEMMRVAKRAVFLQQEFPEGGVGWEGHSLVHIDDPQDVIALLPGASFDGIDFAWVRQ